MDMFGKILIGALGILFVYLAFPYIVGAWRKVADRSRTPKTNTFDGSSPMDVSDVTGFNDTPFVESKRLGPLGSPGEQVLLGRVIRPKTDDDLVKRQLAWLDGKRKSKETGSRRLGSSDLRKAKERIFSKKDLPMMILGPSGSGKTSGPLLCGILTQTDCSTIAVSLKSDVALIAYRSRVAVADAWNRTMPESHPRAWVGVYSPDPATIPDELKPFAVTFSPLTHAGTRKQAKKVAGSLVNSAMTVGGKSTSDNSLFFNRTGTDMLAALLFLNRVGGQNRRMIDVYEQVALASRTTSFNGDEGSDAAIQHGMRLLERSDDPNDDFTLTSEEVRGATKAMRTLAQIDALVDANSGGQASGVLGTLTATLEIYADVAGLVEADDPRRIDLAALLHSNSSLFLMPPASDAAMYKQDLACLIETLWAEIDHVVASSPDGKLPVRCAMFLDELANLTLLSSDRLRQTVSTVRSMNVTPFVMAAQDVSQLDSVYGEDVVRSVLNNTAALVFMPGNKDPKSMRYASEILGQRRVPVVTRSVSPETVSRSRGGEGGETTTRSEKSKSYSVSWQRESILPPERLAQMYEGEAFAIVGSSVLHLLQVRYYQDTTFAALADGALSPLGVSTDPESRVVNPSNDPDSLNTPGMFDDEPAEE